MNANYVEPKLQKFCGANFRFLPSVSWNGPIPGGYLATWSYGVCCHWGISYAMSALLHQHPGIMESYTSKSTEILD